MNFYKKKSSTYARSLFKSISKKKEIINIYQDSSIRLPNKEKNLVNVISKECVLLKAFITSSQKIFEVYKDSRYNQKRKLEMLFEVFPGLSDIMKAFLRILNEQNQLFLIPGISDFFHDLVLEANKTIKVQLIIASPLRKKFGKKVLNKLKAITGANQIFLKVVFDRKILGGFILEYNSLSLDESILKEFRFLISLNPKKKESL